MLCLPVGWLGAEGCSSLRDASLKRGRYNTKAASVLSVLKFP